MFKKRGLSTIIVTVIIIALVLVAVAIVWATISTLISHKTEEISVKKLTINAEILEVGIHLAANNVSLKVQRNAGEGDVLGFKFVFQNLTGKEIVTVYFPLKKLESKRFEFNLSTSVSSLKKISLAPIFEGSLGKEEVGDIIFVYRFRGTESSNYIPAEPCFPSCMGKACGDNGCGVSCGTCSSNYICNLEGRCISPFCNNTVLLLHFNNNSTLGETPTQVIDSSGYGSNGTISGAIWNSSGKYGGSLQFDGKDDYVDFGDFSRVEGVNKFSIGVWVRGYNTVQDLDQYVISKSEDVSGSTFSLFKKNPYGYFIFWVVNSSSEENYVTSDNYLDRSWHYITAVYNGTSLLMYGDGLLQEVTPLRGTTNNVVTSMYVGDNAFSWNGTLDELMVWNRSLSATEISNIYNYGLQIDC